MGRKLMAFVLIASIISQNIIFLAFPNDFVPGRNETSHSENIDTSLEMDYSPEGRDAQVEQANPVGEDFTDESDNGPEETDGEDGEDVEDSEEKGGASDDEPTDDELTDEEPTDEEQTDEELTDEDPTDENPTDEDPEYIENNEIETEEVEEPKENVSINNALGQARAEKLIDVNFSFEVSGTEETEQKTRTLATGAEVSMSVIITPQWENASARAEGVEVFINLPSVDSTDGLPAGICVTGISAGDGSWEIPPLPDTGYYTNELVLKYLPPLPQNGQPSVELTLKFYGKVIEGGLAEVTGGAAFTKLGGVEMNWITEDFDPNANVKIYNTNLSWEAEFLENKLPTKPTVIWDKFNTVPLLLEIRNTSESPTCIINGFSVNFDLPSKISGPMLDRFITMWLYNEGGDPTENVSQPGENQLFTGVPNKGGILIYDVTDMTDEDLFNRVRPNSSPIPYYYIGEGLINVIMKDDEIHPVSGTGDSAKRLLFEVPIPNMNPDEQFTYLSFTAQPTIYLGPKGHELAWSNDPVTALPDIAMPENLPPTIKKLPQQEEPCYGDIGSYYIQNIKNNSNVPIFNSYIIDELPRGFLLNELAYVCDGEEFIHPFPTDEQGNIKDETFTYEVNDPEFGSLWLNLFESPLHNTSPEALKLSVSQQFLDHMERGLFSGKIQIAYKERIEPGEELEGKLVLSGKLTEPYKMVNTAYLLYDYKYDASFTGTDPFAEDYHTVNGEAVEVSAVLNVIRPGPMLESMGKNHTSGSVMKNVTAYYNEHNGYRYYLGNSTGAIIRSGVFEANLPIDPQNIIVDEPTGFILDEIILSKKLLDMGIVEKIELKDYYGAVAEIDISQFAQNNEIVIGKDLWCPDENHPDAVNFPCGVIVYFQEYNGNVMPDDEAYIELKGLVKEYENLSSSAKWYCTFNDGSFVTSSSVETLVIGKPKPSLTSCGVDGLEGQVGNIGNELEVFYGVDNGYRLSRQHRRRKYLQRDI